MGGQRLSGRRGSLHPELWQGNELLSQQSLQVSKNECVSASALKGMDPR